jgi:hypothetical protein
MKSIRLLIAAAFIASSFAIAAPAQAAPCPPDEGSSCPSCNEGTVNQLYRKLTGKELIHCPW